VADIYSKCLLTTHQLTNTDELHRTEIGSVICMFVAPKCSVTFLLCRNLGFGYQ